ncbi:MULTISPECIES: bifunctional glycosyltransferase/CDP-glycerol:glycerophosphate glycerophosphotransferase [Thermomonosporaceae]|uniref:bifunctional glycosyltransferase/CDP-glycerol:glycerophosphate glycerophosphotransferase n=1 Tax=Thermomonosporaceae TaxID=2012 RepID=UPI00255AD0BB|nr:MULTISPECIES: CDP-glycerol glycerophosphotransferase family protein [Thermomonosporaceae]MDL4773225.1 CDP-glycerol glycerophosphotransferase family protein [Actinomadura xylanilytica]
MDDQDGRAPAVSVVIAGGARAELLRTVASVLGQTLGAIEAVVAGTVGEPVLNRLAGTERVRVVRDGREASGTYVMFLAAGETLDRHACLTLCMTAERSGAQVVSGCGERTLGRCALDVHHTTRDYIGPLETSKVAQHGASTGRLYRRDFLEEHGLWPDTEAEAARACTAAEKVTVVPHGVLRAPPLAVSGALRAKAGRLARAGTSTRAKRLAYRKVLTRLPVRKGSVVFESGRGQVFGGSPRAIYERLRADGHPVHAIWSYAGSRDGFPTDARLVRRTSWGYYWALARAQYWIDDHGLPGHLAKRSETTYIQTWHGAAFEFVGFDRPETKLASRAARRRLQRSIDRFDFVVVGSDHDLRTLLPGLRTKAEPLPVGQPRNDALVTGGDSERLDAVLDELGVDGTDTLVLYIPVDGRHAMALDPERFAEQLGDGFVLLTRDARKHGPGSRVVDVSEVQDLCLLMLLADVLVTDHAPVMFDYALLNRPMFFYTPGLEERVRQRGTYFDLAHEAPGPVAQDQDALAAAVRDYRTFDELYGPARRAFAERFGGYERGNAAKEIVERFFAPQRG